MNCEIRYDHYSYCENCGELEPFTAILKTKKGSPGYCAYCTQDNEGVDFLSDDTLRGIEMMEAGYKIEYFAQRINNLTSRYANG